MKIMNPKVLQFKFYNMSLKVYTSFYYYFNDINSYNYSIIVVIEK